jgi:ABC-type dipeptide/oligopeptide/nickel transport system permease component
MKQFILKRILYAFLILFLVSILIFLLGRAGDPIQNASISARMGKVDKEVIEP